MNDTRCYDPKQRAQEKLLEADTLEAGTFPSQHRAKCAGPRCENQGGKQTWEAARPYTRLQRAIVITLP